MDIQQIISLLIVGLAAAYLGRSGLRAWKAFRSGRGGCATGCGKCGCAPKAAPEGKTLARAAQPNVIPLTDVRAVPRKRQE